AQGTPASGKGRPGSASGHGSAADDGTPRALGHPPPSALFREIGLGPDAIGTPVERPEQYQALLRAAVPAAREHMEHHVAPQQIATAKDRAEQWRQEQLAWEADAATARGQSALLLASREAVEVEKKLITEMLPERTFVRPLLVVVPRPEV